MNVVCSRCAEGQRRDSDDTIEGIPQGLFDFVDWMKESDRVVTFTADLVICVIWDGARADRTDQLTAKEEQDGRRHRAAGTSTEECSECVVDDGGAKARFQEQGQRRTPGHAHHADGGHHDPGTTPSYQVNLSRCWRSKQRQCSW